MTANDRQITRHELTRTDGAHAPGKHWDTVQFNIDPVLDVACVRFLSGKYPIAVRHSDIKTARTGFARVRNYFRADGGKVAITATAVDYTKAAPPRKSAGELAGERYDAMVAAHAGEKTSLGGRHWPIIL